jgi:hypothetical protein
MRVTTIITILLVALVFSTGALATDNAPVVPAGGQSVPETPLTVDRIVSRFLQRDLLSVRKA